MTVVVLANDEMKAELLAQGMDAAVQVQWIGDVTQFHKYPEASAYVDLLFEWEDERCQLLKELPARPVIIASMARDTTNMAAHFVCINAWPTFLKRPLVEAYCVSDSIRTETEKLFAAFNRKISWTADVSAFVTARVVAMIINEAYYTLQEAVSTKAEIDTAMKLGTNYPYGPFEWSEKIGIQQIAGLLDNLAIDNPVYTPAPLLKLEALS